MEDSESPEAYQGVPGDVKSVSRSLRGFHVVSKGVTGNIKGVSTGSKGIQAAPIGLKGVSEYLRSVSEAFRGFQLVLRKIATTTRQSLEPIFGFTLPMVNGDTNQPASLGWRDKHFVDSTLRLFAAVAAAECASGGLGENQSL